MTKNPFDQYDEPASSSNPFDQYDEGGGASSSGGTVSDLGKSLKAGVQRLPGMATGLADLPIALATGTRPFTTAADYLGKATGFQPGKWADETNFSQGYQDSKKSVDEAWKGFDDVSKDQSTSKMDAVRKLVSDAPQIAGAYLQNPNYTLGQVAESVPGIFAGGALSKVALGVGRVAGVAADAAAGTAARAAVPGALARTVGDKWAVPVAAGLGEGAVTAGGAMANAQGEDQQKNALAALGAGLGTALIGAGSGRIANALGLETAETALARAGTRAANGAVTPPASVLRRVLGGMVSEAVLQELPQSAQEQMWQNFAEGKPLWSGVARAGTEGALAGGVLGAAANIRGGQAAPPSAPQDPQARSNAEAAAADAQARADAALPPWDTLPGAADPSAVRATGAASAANAPGVEGADFSTSPGAAAPSANGMDFTRDVDTVGLSLQDPAEMERQRAATIDYDPVDTTPAWDTQPGATSPAGGGLDLPAESIDTGALAISDRPLSEKMGLNPAAGALSAAAVQAVDSGASDTMQAAAAQAQVAELAAKAPAPTKAQAEEIDLADIADPYERAYYESFFADAEDAQIGPEVQTWLQDDTNIPDLDAASNASDEDFLRALGANDQEITDAIASIASQPSRPQEDAQSLVGAQANEPADAGEGAGAAALTEQGGQVDAGAPVEAGAAVPSVGAAASDDAGRGDGVADAVPGAQDGRTEANTRAPETSNGEPGAAPAGQRGNSNAPLNTPTSLKEGLEAIRAKRTQGAESGQGLQAGQAEPAISQLGQPSGQPSQSGQDGVVPGSAGALARKDQPALGSGEFDPGSRLSSPEKKEAGSVPSANDATKPADFQANQPQGDPDGPAPNQARQAIAQPAQRAGAQAATPAVAPQSGQGAAPAPRGANWRSNTIQAGRVALELGLNPQGKKLEQMVQEIDAFDAQQNQAAAQDGSAPAATETVAQQTKAQPAQKPSASPASALVPQPNAKRTQVLERISSGRAVFFSNQRAKDFVADNGLATTHSVEQEGRAFYVRPTRASAAAKPAASAPPKVATKTSADGATNQATSTQAKGQPAAAAPDGDMKGQEVDSFRKLQELAAAGLHFDPLGKKDAAPGKVSGIPAYSGNKKSFVQKAGGRLAQWLKNAKGEVLYDAFGGGGGYGLWVVNNAAPNIRTLVINEIDAFRSTKLQWTLEHNGKLEQLFKSPTLAPVIDLMRRLDGGGSVVKAASENARAGEMLNSPSAEKATTNLTLYREIARLSESLTTEDKIALQAVIDRAYASRSSKEGIDTIIAKAVADSREYHAQARAFAQRGGKIHFTVHDGTDASKVPQGSIVLSDPPYLYTTGYKDSGDQALSYIEGPAFFENTKKMLRQSVDLGNTVIYHNSLAALAGMRKGEPFGARKATADSSGVATMLDDFLPFKRSTSAKVEDDFVGVKHGKFTEGPAGGRSGDAWLKSVGARAARIDGASGGGGSQPQFARKNAAGAGAAAGVGAAQAAAELKPAAAKKPSTGAGKASARNSEIALLVKEGGNSTAVLKDIAANSKRPALRLVAKTVLSAGLPFEIRARSDLPKETPARYAASGHYVEFDPAASFDMEQVLLHEAIHAVTSKYIDAFGEATALGKELGEIFRTAQQHAQDTKASFYGLTNTHEFLAEVMTNAEFAQWLSTVPAPSKSDALSRFVKAVAKFFGIADASGAAGQAMSVFERIMLNQASLQAESARKLSLSKDAQVVAEAYGVDTEQGEGEVYFGKADVYLNPEDGTFIVSGAHEFSADHRAATVWAENNGFTDFYAVEQEEEMSPVERAVADAYAKTGDMGVARDLASYELKKAGVKVKWSDILEASRKVGTGSKPAFGEVKEPGNPTQTAAFKKWFAGSKVVDAEGRPLVAYHGTDSDFSTFDANKLGAATRATTSVLGFFSTDNENVANLFARDPNGANVMPVYVSIKNPFEIGFQSAKERSAAGFAADPYRVMKGLISEMAGVKWQDVRGKDVLAWKARVIESGHDGIILRKTSQDSDDGETARSVEDPYHDFYIAFEPEQVKSATGNNGDFDPANPDIRFSRSTSSAPATSPAARAQAVLAVENTASAIRRGWANGPKVVVAYDMQDERIPERIRQEDMRQRSGGAVGAPEGFYYRGTAYLMASKLKTPNDTARVLFHEALGHHGLRNAFGGALKPILQQIVTMRKAAVAAKIKEYGLHGLDNLDQLTAAEEVLAEMAQATPEIGFVKRAIAAIRTWLRENVPGFQSLALTDAELIRNFILPARRFVEGAPRGPGGGVRIEPTMGAFSRATDQTQTEALKKKIKETKEEIDVLRSAEQARALAAEREGVGRAKSAWEAEREVAIKDRVNADVLGVALGMARRQGGEAAAFMGQAREKLAGSLDANTQRYAQQFEEKNPRPEQTSKSPEQEAESDASKKERAIRQEAADKIWQLQAEVEDAYQKLRILSAEARAENERAKGAENGDSTELFHGSFAKGLRNDGTGRFGGIFALPSADRAGAYGSGFIYKMSVANEKIMGKGAPDGFSEKEIWAALRPHLGKDFKEKHKALIWEMVVEDIDPTESRSSINFQSDYDKTLSKLQDLYLALPWEEAKIDIEDYSWAAQKLRGQLAKSLGFDAVSMSDENGTSYLVVSDLPMQAVDPDIRFSRAPTAIESSMGALTPDQDAAYKKVAGVQKVPTLKERADAFKANLGLRMKQALVDQFAPIKDVSQEAYMLARMSKGSDGAVDALLMYGKPFLRDGVLDVNTQDGGFAQVMAGLKGEHDRFFMWVAAQRAERLKAEGKENLMGDSDISALKTLNAGKMTDGTVRVPIYARALQELNAFNESSLKVALQSGLIDQDAYDLMRDQPYVPFYRLMEDEASMTGPRFSSGLRNQQAWKKLKGGTQQLNADLMQNALQNWSHLYAASARNRAALATMDAAEALGVAYKVPSTTKGASKVMRDGKTEYWAVEDPYLLEAISALNYSASPLMKPLAKMKQILTFGVTVNPTFKIRNLIRDSLSSISQSELGYNPLKNVGQGWALTAKDSQVYASMLASGGVMRFGSQERTNQLRDQVQKLGGVVLDEGGLKKFTGQLKSLYDAYADFGDRTENVNRAALYDQLIKKGHNHAEASFMARDLMDFSMGGSHPAVRFLTQSVPFLNARLQGLYKLGRAASEDPRKFATVAGAVSLASLALLGAYSDDEDWKKREDWDRDAYWWFKVGGTAYRIPKPFELGAIGTLAERTAEAMFDEEMTGKRFMQRIGHMAGQTFSLDPVPQAFKPLLDIYANKDSFTGRAIESQADRRLRPQDRYNERTSEVARLLGSMGLPEPSQLIKGDYSPLSPKQVDHLIRGYFSWLGTATATVSDYALRPAMDRGERPELRLRDVFLAGNFVESLPTGSSRYVSQMYEQSRSVEQAFASYREALKQGDTEKAAGIKEQSGDKLRNRVAYATATKRMAEINAQVKRIEASRVLSGEAKRGRLNELEAARGKIAERVAQLT